MSRLAKIKDRYVVYAKNHDDHMRNAQVKSFLGKDVDFIKEIVNDSGTLRITLRLLPNKDYFLYFEYEGTATQCDIFLDYDDKSEVFQFDHLYVKPPFDNRYGENQITGIGHYFDFFTAGSMVTSKIYYYKELIKTYDDGSKSLLYELIKESNIELPNPDGALSVPLGANNNSTGGGGKTSFFLLISQDKLFKSKGNMNTYMKHYYDGLANNSVWNSFFVCPAGTYTKLPYSIEPFTRNGYGYSIHHSSRKDMVSWYEQHGERFYENFLANAVLQVYLYQSQNCGLFLATYTSTWLKKSTGITAPYIDTRCNETFILMIEDLKKSMGWVANLEPDRDYADFFCTKYEQGKQVYRAGGSAIGGVFFPDYFKESVKVLPHASLNHQLGVAQLLLRNWKKYRSDQYLRVFNAILQFIEATVPYWKQDNGDLYYGVRKSKDGKLEFFDNDYIYVTLLDLLLVQTALIDEGLGRRSAIQKLIEIKISYLKTTEYDIFHSSPKLASGERIDSVALALRLYKKLHPVC